MASAPVADAIIRLGDPTTTTATRDILETPLYRVGDLARFFDTPTPTVRRWFFAVGQRAALVPADAKEHELSFTNLVEAYVLVALRREYRISLQEIRKAVKYLEEELKTPHPLTDRRLKTDRVRLYFDDRALIDVSSSGQTAIRDVIGPHLERIEWDKAGALLRLWPTTRPADSVSPQPRVVAIDPRVGFGRPTLADTGVRTAIVVQRFKGGDSLQALARDYGRTVGEIEEAIRFETRAA